VLLAAAVGGCGGGSSSSHAPAAKTAPATVAVPAEPPAGSGANPDLGDARLADCAMWRKGDVAERYGTIREISGFAGAPTGTPGYSGATMSDREAYRVFANWCKPRNTFATYFKLYKLYTRAAAFRPHH
jgi:hypothetical protein